jgi:sugar (pentulose or hexulose) kinase
LTPRPDDPADFLKAMLEGIAGIEVLAYAKLRALGAPQLSSVRTVGGAAKNEALTGIRERLLDVAIKPPTHVEAAYGSALLARHGSTA